MIIFDCDGVLIDGEILSYKTYAKILAEENFGVSSDELLKRFSGLSLADMITGVEKTYGVHLNSNIYNKIDKAICEVFRAHLKPMPGIVDVLEKLKRQNIPFCLVSNGLRSRIDCALDATGLKKYFPKNHLFDVSLVKNGKPSPDLYLHAALAMGAAPSACLVIDDSAAGIQAAKSAHMLVIGFLGGEHAKTVPYQKAIRDAKPDAIAYSMREVIDLINLHAIA